jgi:hypothetical protein
LHEAKRLPVLNDAQAIEAITLGLSKVFRAEKIVRPIRGDVDRLRTAPELLLVILEFHHAEQIAADGAWRDERGHEFDVEIVGRAERPIEFHVRCAGIGERRCDFARRDAPSDDRALGEEVVPRLDAEALEIESRNRRRGDSRPRGFSGPRGARAQHESRCGENGGTHRARGDSCTGDVVRRQRAGAAAQRPAGFAGKKRVELPLAHGVVNDHRLLVRDDFRARDVAAEIDARDDIERDRRITRRRDDVEGRKHVADNPVALVDGDRRRRALLDPEAFGAGVDHRHYLGRQPLAELALFSGRRCGEDERCQRDADAAR